MKGRILSLAVVCVLTVMSSSAKGGPVMVEDGKKVKMDYTLTVEGAVVDTSEGKEPLEYTQGEGMIIPGLEKELAGMKVGDQKQVTVLAAEAYGPVNPEAVQEVPRSMFPADIDIQPGMMIPLQDKEGRSLPAVVTEVKGDVVILDFNHPLAGKDLSFDVKIVGVE